MFISKRPKENGTYGSQIFSVSILIYLLVVDYSDENELLYFLGIGGLFILSFFIENRIIKLSKQNYEELKNDVKDDIRREVLEEIEDKK